MVVTVIIDTREPTATDSWDKDMWRTRVNPGSVTVLCYKTEQSVLWEEEVDTRCSLLVSRMSNSKKRDPWTTDDRN